MCPNLEKLRSNLALLAGMQRYFQGACATIGYLRDAWAQYWREDVWGGGEGSPFVQSGSRSPHVLSCLFLPYTLASLY